MFRAVAIVIILFLAFPITQAAGNGDSHGHKKAQGHHQMDMGKGDIVPCMQSMVKSNQAKPKNYKKGKVVILKPQNGAVVKSRSVRVVFDVPDKGSTGDHLHIYMDGRCLNMIKAGDSYVVTSMRDGKHRIELRLVDKDHFEYGPKASVEVNVIKGRTKKKPGMAHTQ